ncbi:MAG: hypothetical protein ACRDRJ_17985, partial [Streptosporangiaceae bacterium]
SGPQPHPAHQPRPPQPLWPSVTSPEKLGNTSRYQAGMYENKAQRLARGSSPASTMNIKLLGLLSVTDDGGNEIRLPAGRARIVLAVLCADAGREISRP